MLRFKNSSASELVSTIGTLSGGKTIILNSGLEQVCTGVCDFSPHDISSHDNFSLYPDLNHDPNSKSNPNLDPNLNPNLNRN